jgi:hypothetical protein
MRTSDGGDIARILDGYHGLSECVIESVLLKDYGTTVEIGFDYIWDDEGNVRKDLDRVKELTLRFRIVQVFHMENALNASMSRHPENINWGLNEVALVRVVSDDSLPAYAALSVPFNRVDLLWEDERRITLIFSELEVLQKW